MSFTISVSPSSIPLKSQRNNHQNIYVLIPPDVPPTSVLLSILLKVGPSDDSLVNNSLCEISIDNILDIENDQVVSSLQLSLFSSDLFKNPPEHSMENSCSSEKGTKNC